MLRIMLLALVCAALAGSVQAVTLPGLGELTGQVHGGAADSLAVVSARNRQRDVAYIVYVVNGRYRAVLESVVKANIKPFKVYFIFFNDHINDFRQ